jgi:hypothetical protein
MRLGGRVECCGSFGPTTLGDAPLNGALQLGQQSPAAQTSKASVQWWQWGQRTRWCIGNQPSSGMCRTIIPLGTVIGDRETPHPVVADY